MSPARSASEAAVGLAEPTPWRQDCRPSRALPWGTCALMSQRVAPLRHHKSLAVLQAGLGAGCAFGALQGLLMAQGISEAAPPGQVKDGHGDSPAPKATVRCRKRRVRKRPAAATILSEREPGPSLWPTEAACLPASGHSAHASPAPRPAGPGSTSGEDAGAL